MSAKLRSGFYLGKKSALLLALLLAVLLLAFLVLAILYGRCAREAEEPDLLNPGVPTTARANANANANAEPTARPGPWDQQRLPRHVTPIHYSLLLWPHLAPGLPKPSTHSGQVNITVRCREATSMVLLHSAELTYRGASVIPLGVVWTAPLNQYLVLELLENLTVLFPRMWMIISQLQPIDARSVYPCFDEPAMKATFNISIVHHPSYVALSNMPALDISDTLMNETIPINWTITTFETTLKMSTYITAFVVCKFDYVTTTERGNQIRIWGRKDAIKKGFANYALNITGQIFSLMEDLLNISYPLSKTDLVAVPLMNDGAMENWGLMTFYEASLLNDPEDKSISYKMRICRVVAHEVAHQWFGNLVTMDWWNDIWLNEGFATYFEQLGLYYIEHIMPLKISLHYIILKFYKLTNNPVLVLLQSYLSAFSFSNAVQDDLWNHIQKVIDEQNDFQLPTSVKIIMDSWTFQKGFPVLTVDFSTGTIMKVSYTLINTTLLEVRNSTWIIPISWIRNGTLQPLVWLDKRSKIFPEMKISDSEQDWIVLNVNMTAYCRINYGQNYWRILAKVLEDNPKTTNMTLQTTPGARNLYDIERILTTACWFGLRNCLDLASEFFNNWMNNSKHDSTICCYGIWMGNEEEWEFLWKIFQKNDTNDTYKPNIFYALSCTRIPRLLQSLHTLVILADNMHTGWHKEV
uniref:Laeverin n=1 Tax=Naja naja TaxID=35670 RepID=A0A8C6X1W8_NAJNA